MVKRLLITVAAALALAPSALAGGANYAFDGGTRAQQTQVKAALDASSFDFSVVPGPVTIHVRRGIDSYATAGHVWLDADLLNAGTFAWGVVQHEYAHQVDFLRLDAAARAQLHTLLGGVGWWSGGDHDSLDCERFADLLAWAYWPSAANVIKPGLPGISRAGFRAALAGVLPGRSLQIAVAPARKR